MASYPKYKYHPKKTAVVVQSAEAEKELGEGWYDSPADYGVETCPSRTPDPDILAKKAAYEKREAEKAAHEKKSPLK